jgi:two-component system LytT family response regulator
MTATRIVIIDDDRLIREKLSDLIESHFPDSNILAACLSAEEGVKAIREHKPNLVFLDIMLPGMNGFEMLKHVDTLQFELIFVTAHNEYAIQAIRHSALDYLLKPLKTDEFKMAISRFVQKVDISSNLNKKIESLEQNLADKKISDQKLVINSSKGTELIPVTDIVYCVSESNYTDIHLKQGKRILASRTLGHFEEELASSNLFVRLHRSILVNRSFVSRLHSEGEVELHDGTRLEVSQRRMPEVRKYLSA